MRGEYTQKLICADRRITKMTIETINPQEMLPLTANVFNILLALASGEKHGYGIMKEVDANTDGSVILRTGTLYGSIQRMMAADLIEESDERPAPEQDDERRRYYRLTDFGLRVLQAETNRLVKLIAIARERNVLGAPRLARGLET
jgi:DNA-binding PadR family transcriptional regulator